MNNEPSIGGSSWIDEFLTLGENLVKQPDSASLRDLLSSSIQDKLNCAVDIWLAEPHYPLPGEPPVKLLPSDSAPKLIQKCYQERRTLHNRRLKSRPDPVDSWALPIVTQENLLGVLLATRPATNPFSSGEIQLLRQLVSTAALAMQVNRQSTLKNWRYDQLSLVRSVTAQIATVLNVDELSLRITNLIQCSFDYYHVAIYTVDELTGKIQFQASSLSCQPNRLNPLVTMEFDKGIIFETAKTKKEHIVQDVSLDPYYLKIESLPDTKSEVSLPLLFEDHLLGILDIQSNKVGAFHENDMLVLRSLADSIAVAFENAHLYSSLEQRAKQMSAVAEIGSAISSILDLDVLLKEVVSVISKNFSIPFIHIFTVHPDRGKIIFEAGIGPRTRNLKPNSFAFELDAKIGIIPFVARTGNSFLANDVAQEPMYRPTRYFSQRVKSELTIPLRFGDEVLGVLDLQSDQLNHFSRADQLLFESLASGIAQSIRNASLFSTEKWRRRVADSFRDTAGLLISNLALPELLDKVLTALEDILPCDASAVWLLEDDPNLPIDKRPLHLVAARGVSSKKILEQTEGSTIVRNFLNTAIRNNGYSIRKTEDPYGPLGKVRNFNSNYSSLAVSLRSGENVLGVLAIAHRNEGRYGSEAGAIATTFSSYAAVAIENSRLFTTAQEEAWSSTVLLQVAEALQSITSMDGLFSTMVRLTPLLVGVEQCAILLIRPDGGTFDMKNWYGFQPAEDELALKDTEAVAFLKLTATLNTVFVTNPAEELKLRAIPFSEKKSTVVLLPLIAHEELLGAFLVSHNSRAEYGRVNKFSDQTLAILQSIAQQTAVALENMRLIESRQEEAYITAVLLQVAQTVVSQNKLEDILDTIVHLMPILVGVDTCVIYEWDKINNRFLPAAVTAPTHTEQEEILGRTYSTGEFPLLDSIIETDGMKACQFQQPDLAINAWPTLSCTDNLGETPSVSSNWLLGYPLSIKGEKYGIMITREINVQSAYRKKRAELIR